VNVRALDRKMLRELWRLRGQLLSIGLVVAAAVMMLVTMRGTYEALVVARASYYRDYKLGDVWSALEQAPQTLGDRHARSALARRAGAGAVHLSARDGSAQGRRHPHP
jgi:putative ABC transport system permease protein